MTEFIQSLGFWQWCGLIVLASIVLAGPAAVFSRRCDCACPCGRCGGKKL